MPITSSEVNKLLEHVGILGMKWGRRRGGLSSVRIAGRPLIDPHRTSGSEDHKAVSQLRKKRVRDMSNDELRKLTTRMGLEKQYKDLKSSNISAGRKLFSNALQEVGKETAKSFISAGAKTGVATLVEILRKRRESQGG